MALVEGTTTSKFEGLRQHLETSIINGDDIGASVAVFHQGELVCDLWGGYADEARTIPWERDTLVNVWSTTKTMTFLVALMLSDRGELDFDERVSTYWPEFAANGKEGIEVNHLMNHTAGLSGWSDAITPEDLADWDLCVQDLASQAPWWEDRSVSGYHALTQGYLIGEVVRRITGTTIGQFFKSEVADVLGAGQGRGRRRPLLDHPAQEGQLGDRQSRGMHAGGLSGPRAQPGDGHCEVDRDGRRRPRVHVDRHRRNLANSQAT